MSTNNYKDLYEFCNEGFAPYNNDMELIRYSKENINKLVVGSRGSEIWTDSDCLIVNPSNMKELLERLK